MPPAVIGGIIVAAGTVGAAEIAANSASSAAKQEQQAGQQALGLATTQFNAGTQALAPYQYGGPALAGLNHPVTNQPYHPVTTSPLAGYGLPTAPTSYAPIAPNARSLALGQSQGGTGMVLLRAPTGEIKQVPTNQAQQFIARGATVVQ